MAVSTDQNITTDTDALRVPSVGDFWSLLKPRVMSLVIFTGFAGMYLAPGDIHPLVFVISLFAIAAGAGQHQRQWQTGKSQRQGDECHLEQDTFRQSR